MLHAHFQTFALYNRWANRRLYDAVAALPEADFRRDLGAFFGSLRGTLNHILVGDRAWLRRITGQGPMPERLDEILYDEFPALRAARATEDERIIRAVASLDDARLAEPLDYTTMAGTPCREPLSQILAHVFNHQTHHRGQAHGLLSLLGRDPPPLDLIYYVREAKAG